MLSLTGLVARAGRVEVYAELRDDRTFSRRLAAHTRAMQRWEAEALEPARLPPPPVQPADAFEDLRLRLSVSDDIGTDYRFTSSALDGSGTERQAMWAFTPGVPNELDEVLVAVDGEVRYRGRPERDQGTVR